MRFGRHRQVDTIERFAAWRVEDEELALTRVDLEALVTGHPRDLVGAEPGAVDRDIAAELLAAGEGQRQARVLLGNALDPGFGSQLGAAAHGRPRQRQGVGDRIGDRLARHLERAVVAQVDPDAVRTRSLGDAGDGRRVLLVSRRQHGAAMNRGDAELLEHGAAELGRA